MSLSDAIVLGGQNRRRPGPFSLGLRETAGGVESAANVSNVAAPTSTRARLTAEQLEARQAQRAEDDELIRAAQKGDRSAFDALVRRYDRSVLQIGRASCRERV